MFNFSPRVVLRPETAHQKSTEGRILEWMQANLKKTKSTNSTAMAGMAIADGVAGTKGSLRQRIQKMVNNQMLFRAGSKRRSNFVINYMHKDIPPYILEGAPEEEKRKRAQIEAGLQKNEKLDEVGCIVTSPEIERPEAKEDEPDRESEGEYPELDAIIEELSVPVQIRKEKESGGTNISITLNLNLG